MQKTRGPLAIDLFCGVGGFSLGFAQSGFNVIAGIDADPVNVSTYSRNFPTTRTLQSDISRLTGSQLRRMCGLNEKTQIDVLLGGPPCQGFSVIGKRNLDDPRNALVGEFCRLVIELKPRYFVLENVAGLMFTSTRSVLERALNGLRKEGYEWVSPIRVLDAQDFGIPQRRRRVFVLGFRAGEMAPKYPETNGHTRPTVWDAISDLQKVGNMRALYSDDVLVGPLGPPSAYSAKLRDRRAVQRLTGCLRCRHGKNVVKRFRGTRQGRTERISRFTKLKKTMVAPTLRAGTPRSHGSFTAARPIHPTQPRCITVREAARLHSFPDRFRFHPTQWHGFQQVGNSVPPMLAKAVAKSVRVAVQTKRSGLKREKR
jgi:DNA (cytosine-5)-methyltransferase 1